METNGATQAANLEISGSNLVVSTFLPMFGKGAGCKIQTGSCVRDVLCTQLGVEEDYLANRIQTVFLNGKAVDDVDNAIVVDGDTLALSAAMPGLVGATMRKGGHYAAMRGEISHRSDCDAVECRTGRITIKLFNVLQKEIGFLFLLQGVRFLAKDLETVLQNVSDDFWEDCRSITLDGRKKDPRELIDFKWAAVDIDLSIRRS